jgi:group II intron reverse transcriptase/maturase
VEIPKPDGGIRKLGVPCVVDRLIQQALLQVLQRRWDPTFSEHSYGFRPGRSAHQAVTQAQAYIAEGYNWVVDIDLEQFFDRVNHDRLMARVAERVADKRVLKIIRAFLNAGVMEDGVFKPTTVGTPQGGIISPLLANIVLNRLDWQLHEAGYHFARYADDFVVVCQTKRQAQEALTLVTQTLETDLGLKLSPEKTKVTTYGKGYDFLGFTLSSRSRRMRDKSVQKLKAKIRELTVRKHNLDSQVIDKLNAVIRGTANYFATGSAPGRLGNDHPNTAVVSTAEGVKRDKPLPFFLEHQNAHTDQGFCLGSDPEDRLPFHEPVRFDVAFAEGFEPGDLSVPADQDHAPGHFPVFDIPFKYICKAAEPFFREPHLFRVYEMQYLCLKRSDAEQKEGEVHEDPGPDSAESSCFFHVHIRFRCML